MDRFPTAQSDLWEAEQGQNHLQRCTGTRVWAGLGLSGSQAYRVRRSFIHTSPNGLEECPPIKNRTPFISSSLGGAKDKQLNLVGTSEMLAIIC